MIKASVLAREIIAAEVDLAKFELPEAELVSISKDAEVLIKFSKEIQFPTDLLLAVNGSVKKDHYMNDDLGELITVESLFTLQMMSSETMVISENLKSWRISSLTSKEIKIALTFAKPHDVSQGDEHDVLSVYAGLGAFKDKDGINLPSFEFLKGDLPP